MFGAAEAAGAFDLGELFGGKPTGVDISSIAAQLDVESPISLFDRFVDSLDSRKQDIFISRICRPSKPDTLLQISERWAVTRERIRQTETKTKELAIKQIGRVFRRYAIPFFKPYRGKIVRSKYINSATRSLTAGAKWAEAASGFALTTAGNWKRNEEWISFNQDENNFDLVEELMGSHFDDFDVTSCNSVDSELNQYFLSESDRNIYLAGKLNTISVNGYWCKNSKLSQAVVALRFLGRPSTKNEISEAMGGHSVDRIGALLSRIEGVVRADKYRWGFSEWIEDEYTGIVEEIEQRIEEGGGSVAFNSLISELPNKFSVSESSVRSYIATDAFLLEDGYVRHATLDAYAARPPESVRGCVRCSLGWGQRVILKEHNFTGYSLGVSFHIAFANGIRPDDNLIVPIFNTDFEGSIIWRPTATSRRVDVGKISTAIKYLGFREGEEVVVIPLRDQIIVKKASSCSDFAGADEDTDPLEPPPTSDFEKFVDPLFGLLE